MSVENKDREVVLCRRCGRKLFGGQSKKLQFGPSCYKLWKKEHSSQIALFTMPKGGNTDGGQTT